MILLQTPPAKAMPGTTFNAASNRASVMVNGTRLADFALIRDDRVQVPLRAIAQRLGMVVQFYPETHKIVLTRDRNTIELILGENMAYAPSPIYLDYPAHVEQGVTMVPLRFVSQAFGAKVTYRPKDRVAVVTTASE